MDLIPKENKKNNGGVIIRPSLDSGLVKLKVLLSSRGLLISALIALVLVAAGWAGMRIYERYLSKKIEAVKEKTATTFSAEDQALAKKIVDLQRRAVWLEGLLKSHIYTSGPLDKLAGATLPQVQWLDYSLNVEAKTLTLKGRAADYSVVARQLLALAEAGFSLIELPAVTLDKIGGVSLGVNLKFDPKMIQSK